MRRFILTFIVAAMALGSGRVAEAKFDGSVPLLCVPIEITECEAAGKCYQGSAEDVNLPQFIKVNFKDKLLTGVDNPPRTTPIDYMERENGKIVLHGGQAGRGWTIVISEATGKLTASISDDGTGFVIFGACTAL